MLRILAKSKINSKYLLNGLGCSNRYGPLNHGNKSREPGGWWCWNLLIKRNLLLTYNVERQVKGRQLSFCSRLDLLFNTVWTWWLWWVIQINNTWDPNAQLFNQIIQRVTGLNPVSREYFLIFNFFLEIFLNSCYTLTCKSLGSPPF